MTTTTTVEKLVYEGWGLARLDSGQVVFVKSATTGETIELELPEAQANKPAFVQSYKLLKPSQDRIEPVCKDFKTCGGCHWQYLTYEHQLNAKQAILLETLKRNNVDTTNTTIGQIIESPQQLQYRSAAQWQVSYDATGQCQLGYYQYGTKEFTTFETCHIIPEPVNQLVKHLEKVLSKLQSQRIRKIHWRANHTNKDWLLLLDLAEVDEETLSELSQLFLQLAPEFPQVKGASARDLAGNHHAFYGDDSLETEVAGQTFQLNSQTFFQVNLSIIPLLIDWIKPQLATPADSFLDLYGGVGLFSKCFAENFSVISLIEENTASATCAMNNLAPFMTEKKVQVFAKPVDTHLKSHNKNYDVVVLDPPRKGCSNFVLNWATEHTNKQLIYVSCNPTTLARDLKRL